MSAAAPTPSDELFGKQLATQTFDNYLQNGPQDGTFNFAMSAGGLKSYVHNLMIQISQHFDKGGSQPAPINSFEPESPERRAVEAFQNLDSLEPEDPRAGNVIQEINQISDTNPAIESEFEPESPENRVGLLFDDWNRIALEL